MAERASDTWSVQQAILPFSTTGQEESQNSVIRLFMDDLSEPAKLMGDAVPAKPAHIAVVAPVERIAEEIQDDQKGLKSLWNDPDLLG